MPRTDDRFRQAFNALLDYCPVPGVGGELPAESVLADHALVSRTVVRAVLHELDERGIVRWRGRQKRVLRLPVPDDRMVTRARIDSPEALAALDSRFFEWVLRFDVAPGTALNVAQLSREFDVATHALQACLSGLARFKLVERRSRGGWRLLGFTRDFAIELSDLRALLEVEAVRRFACLPARDPAWQELRAIEADHRVLLGALDERFHDFSRLDERFHDCLGSAVRNRFVTELRKVVSLIFHYHYQWDKSDERARNAAAIGEHLEIVAALQNGDAASAEAAAVLHLTTARQTLLSSLREHRLG